MALPMPSRTGEDPIGKILLVQPGQCTDLMSIRVDPCAFCPTCHLATDVFSFSLHWRSVDALSLLIAVHTAASLL